MTDDLNLGLTVGYWQKHVEDLTETVLAAERLGYDSVFTAEAYGSDALTPLAWYGARTSKIKLGTAVTQLSARTPTATAMHAMTLDGLSGGRLLLGVGVSGPQVVEGWYGQPFARPLARTREYVDIMRQVWAREAPVASNGPHYRLPLSNGTGLGKPLKSIAHPLRADIPVYIGAEGPKNVALAAEVADGWIPFFLDPTMVHTIYGDSLAGRRPGFDIAAPVTTVVTDDLDSALLAAKMPLTLYIGGMGAKDRNFHLDLIGRLGYAEAAQRVQELFLAGRREEALRAVPDELADATSLLGPIARIKERIQLWRDSPITTILIGGVRDEPTLRALAEVMAG